MEQNRKMSTRVAIFALIAVLSVPSLGAVLPSKVAFDDFLGVDIASETVREAVDNGDLRTITTFNTLAGVRASEPIDEPKTSVEAMEPEASFQPMMSMLGRMSEDAIASPEDMMPSAEPELESFARMEGMPMESPEELESSVEPEMEIMIRMSDMPMESPEEELVPSVEPELGMMSGMEAEPMESPEMSEASNEPELLLL